MREGVFGTFFQIQNSKTLDIESRWMNGCLVGLMAPSPADGRDASFLYHVRGLDCSVVRAGRRKSSSMKSAPALVLFLALAALLSPSPSLLSHPRSGRENVGIVSHASCVLPPPAAAKPSQQSSPACSLLRSSSVSLSLSPLPISA